MIENMQKVKTITGIEYTEANLFLHNATSKETDEYADIIVLMCFVEPCIDSLETIDIWLDCSFGVEYITLPNDEYIPYLNTGDTYSSTILFMDGKFVISSWGDIYEQKEQEYCDENSVLRCSYCGEYTSAKWGEDCTECKNNTQG